MAAKGTGGGGWTRGLGLADADYHTQDGEERGPPAQHRGLKMQDPVINHNGK